MISRPRTTLVSATAVALTLMLLGSSARAQSIPNPSPQSYLRFLSGLPEARNGMSLMQRYTTLERRINILQRIPQPGPRIVQQLATLFTQQTRVYANLQSSINALLARQAVLQRQYLSLQAQKEALLSAGRVNQARRVAIQQGQVSNVLNSVQRLVASERGVATPVR
jgi:hypothetical protein